MAASERRFFVLSRIFRLVLFICCIYSAQSSNNDFRYRIKGKRLYSPIESVEFKSLRHHRYVRAAVPSVSTQPPSANTGPDSVTSGNGAQTLPDSSTASGPQAPINVAPTNESAVSVTMHGNDGNGSSSNDSSTNITPTPTPQPQTTTEDNPFANADIIHDFHEYYKSKAVKDSVDNHYVELATAEKHQSLSDNHRVAAVIPLKFHFPFYGHLVNNVTVATGGFIYMSPFLHQWLTATQYIAPLMANFDPSLSTTSNIYYLSEADKFTVEWKDVRLQDQKDVGLFTFQTSLHINGSISFVYKDIPIDANKISDEEHPVKIGLSDAYYNDTYIKRFGIRRRTIYEYHQLTLKRSLVRTGAVIFINPLPTCNLLTDCHSCTNHTDVDFDCKWCNIIGRCSDGLDWYRQHWDKYDCNKVTKNQTKECIGLPPPLKPIIHPITPLKAPKKCEGGGCGKGKDAPVAVIVVVLLLVLALIGGVAGWAYYAYTHPNSKSGMWLIQHRPSQIKAKIQFWKNSSSSDSGAKYRTETDA